LRKQQQSASVRKSGHRCAAYCGSGRVGTRALWECEYLQSRLLCERLKLRQWKAQTLGWLERHHEERLESMESRARQKPRLTVDPTPRWTVRAVAAAEHPPLSTPLLGWERLLHHQQRASTSQLRLSRCGRRSRGCRSVSPLRTPRLACGSGSCSRCSVASSSART